MAEPSFSWYYSSIMEVREFDPIGRGLDLGTFFGLLAGAAATAIRPDVLFFATPTLAGMGLGLLIGWRIKRKYFA